jgi:DNA-binding transcriptional ArsR family regulator
MVNQSRRPLDRIFQALSDPTRRHMLRMLARGDRRVAELAKPHAMSAPAISKHLRVLERAGLVRRMRDGRSQLIQLRTPPLRRASRWIGFYEQFWSTQLESLEEMLGAPRSGATRRSSGS